MKLPLHTASSFALVSLLLVSCASAPPSADPQKALAPLTPERWSQPTEAEPSRHWIDDFQDERLGQLIEEAFQNNFGLESARELVNASAAAARIRNAARLPSLGVGLQSSDGKSIASFDPLTSIESERHALSLNARWEIDLWNRLGNRYQASRVEYEASRYEFEAFKLSLAGQIAKAWFDAIELKQQLQLARATAQSYQSNLNSLENRYRRGLVDAFDLRLTRAQTAGARASATSRLNQADTALRFLETLLGRYPSAELETTADLPELSVTPGASIPAQTLSQRPDLLAQQLRVEAALKLAQAAERNWLPNIALTASDGTLSNDFSQLLDSDFSVWSIVGEASAALFQSGALKAERQQLNASQLSQLSQYKETALQAFREVETALRAERDLKDLQRETETLAAESGKAEDQAWSLYERGLIDISAALDAQRRSFEAQSQLISIRNRRLQNRIDLHLALGGDF
ncbi:efflux transporter outer membrane subunit [Pelagicoccus sp. SDUM812003]|uniref:efflux transporter outer membrane subunit n=1 Tax=Pelagicoccus sp. SDUM812003 TaxID=3041267 RepID=UPI00280F7529|nr:efflux transporter outer membrane subunit [Pelagicoccus sp. SDUM812003]MDQ8201879.1 efflux transporter outer membrane subunit [Pelagicoccus sp. SDUM812003]